MQTIDNRWLAPLAGCKMSKRDLGNTSPSALLANDRKQDKAWMPSSGGVVYNCFTVDGNGCGRVDARIERAPW